MRQVRGQGVDDGDDPLHVAYADVEVDAEGLDAAGQPLHLLDQFGIALHGSHHGVPPVADRMGARARQHDAAGLHDRSRLGDGLGQVGLGLTDGVTDPGNDLYL